MTRAKSIADISKDAFKKENDELKDKLAMYEAAQQKGGFTTVKDIEAIIRETTKGNRYEGRLAENLFVAVNTEFWRGWFRGQEQERKRAQRT